MSRKNTFTSAAVLFLTFLLCIGCDPQLTSGLREQDVSREIFVINSLAQTISYYDIDRQQLYNRSADGMPFTVGTAPNQLIYDDTRDYLYCVNSLSNSISIFDQGTLEMLDEFYLGPSINPWSMTLNDDDSTYAYVSAYVGDTIEIIDLDTLETVESVSIPSDASNPEQIEYHEGHVYLSYVNYDDGDFLEGGILVYTVEGDSLSFLKQYKVHQQANPQSFFIDENNSQLHLICTGVNESEADDGTVEIFSIKDDGSLEYADTLEIGGSPTFFPYAIDYDDSIIYLANTGGYLTSYSLQNGEREPAVVHDSSSPLFEDADESLFAGVAIYDDKIMISAFSSDELLIIDEEGELLNEISSGDGPHYLLVQEDD